VVPVPRLLSATDVPPAVLVEVAAGVVGATEERRSTWSRWNLTAETIRAIRDRGWQFTTPEICCTSATASSVTRVGRPSE
jgi:hypothetical protein